MLDCDQNQSRSISCMNMYEVSVSAQIKFENQAFCELDAWHEGKYEGWINTGIVFDGQAVKMGTKGRLCNNTRNIAYMRLVS